MRPPGRGACVLVLVVPSVAMAGAALGACDGDPLYAYLGQKFDPARGCLSEPLALDVMVGTRKGDCPAVCLVGQIGDGAVELYVSRDCAPYPRGYTLSDSERFCAEAKAALARGDRCLSDGGQTNAPQDAALDIDASVQIDSGIVDASPGSGDPARDAGDAAGGAEGGPFDAGSE